MTNCTECTATNKGLSEDVKRRGSTTYSDVDTLASAGRSDKQTRPLVSDQQMHQPSVSHCIHSRHNYLTVRRVAWYWRHVRQRPGPLRPLAGTFFHHLVIIDESISWDWRQVGARWWFSKTWEVQTGSRLLGHSTLWYSHILALVHKTINENSQQLNFANANNKFWCKTLPHSIIAQVELLFIGLESVDGLDYWRGRDMQKLKTTLLHV